MAKTIEELKHKIQILKLCKATLTSIKKNECKSTYFKLVPYTNNIDGNNILDSVITRKLKSFVKSMQTEKNPDFMIRKKDILALLTEKLTVAKDELKNKKRVEDLKPKMKKIQKGGSPNITSLFQGGYISNTVGFTDLVL
jgi:hypothetical protein